MHFGERAMDFLYGDDALVVGGAEEEVLQEGELGPVGIMLMMTKSGRIPRSKGGTRGRR